MDLLDELNRIQHVSAVTCCETTETFSGIGAVECDRTGVNNHIDRGSFPFLHHRGTFAGFIGVSADFSGIHNKATAREKLQRSNETT